MQNRFELTIQENQINILPIPESCEKIFGPKHVQFGEDFQYKKGQEVPISTIHIKPYKPGVQEDQEIKEKPEKSAKTNM